MENNRLTSEQMVIIDLQKRLNACNKILKNYVRLIINISKLLPIKNQLELKPPIEDVEKFL